MWHKYTALILGSGGASKAVQYVLGIMNIPFKVVSRKESLDYLSYNKITKTIISNTSLIINTTPLGMYPNVEASPDIDYNHLSNNHYLYDLVYNPEITSFLKKGFEMDSHIKSGGDMLVFQAEKSWELWNLS